MEAKLFAKSLLCEIVSTPKILKLFIFCEFSRQMWQSLITHFRIILNYNEMRLWPFKYSLMGFSSNLIGSLTRFHWITHCNCTVGKWYNFIKVARSKMFKIKFLITVWRNWRNQKASSQTRMRKKNDSPGKLENWFNLHSSRKWVKILRTTVKICC